jgi:hypothetical protein
MKNLITIGSIIGVGTTLSLIIFGSMAFIIGPNSRPNHRPNHRHNADYTIELTKKGTVIINNDTIKLNQLEEYIVNDNI